MKPYLEQQNLGELITAEHRVLIETCESGNYHRYAIVGQIWQLGDPWWNKTSQGRHGIISWNLALIGEVDHGIKKKIYVDTSPFKKDLGLLNSGMLNRGEVLCITVAVDQSTVKIGGNDDNLPFKIKWGCSIAVRWMKEGTFATWRWMGSMMNCNYLRKIPKEKRFDELVESKNFIWFVGMNITPFLFLTYWNYNNSGAQHYPKHSPNTSGMRGEKFEKELLW